MHTTIAPLTNSTVTVTSGSSHTYRDDNPSSSYSSSPPASPSFHPSHDNNQILMSHSYNSSSSPSPASPIRNVPSGRVIRRKRSSANAALTSRPSTASLRDARKLSISGRDMLLDGVGFTSLNISGEGGDGSLQNESMDVTNESALDPSTAFIPTKEDCILIHTMVAGPDQLPQLAYALFQPNLLIDANGTIEFVVDRERWECLRATVEETRIIFMQSTSKDGLDQGGKVDVAKCWSLCDFPDSVTDASQVLKGTFYVQPTSGCSNSNPARMSSPRPFLQLTVEAPDWSTLSNPSLCSSLPNQVRALLEQSRTTQEQCSSTTSSAGSAVCQRILALT